MVTKRTMNNEAILRGMGAVLGAGLFWAWRNRERRAPKGLVVEWVKSDPAFRDEDPLLSFESHAHRKDGEPEYMDEPAFVRRLSRY